MPPHERQCRRHGRGRPRIPRTIENEEAFSCFGPLCLPEEGEGGTVLLLPEEVEILKLVDLRGFDQQGAASALGISRKTAWRDLHRARRKVADALVHGKTIRIGLCGREKGESCPPADSEDSAGTLS